MAWITCPHCGTYLVDNTNTVPRYYCACGYNSHSVTWVWSGSGYAPHVDRDEKPEGMSEQNG